MLTRPPFLQQRSLIAIGLVIAIAIYVVQYSASCERPPPCCAGCRGEPLRHASTRRPACLAPSTSCPPPLILSPPFAASTCVNAIPAASIAVFASLCLIILSTLFDLCLEGKKTEGENVCVSVWRHLQVRPARRPVLASPLLPAAAPAPTPSSTVPPLRPCSPDLAARVGHRARLAGLAGLRAGRQRHVRQHARAVAHLLLAAPVDGHGAFPPRTRQPRGRRRRARARPPLRAAAAHPPKPSPPLLAQALIFVVLLAIFVFYALLLLVVVIIACATGGKKAAKDENGKPVAGGAVETTALKVWQTVLNFFGLDELADMPAAAAPPPGAKAPAAAADGADAKLLA